MSQTGLNSGDSSGTETFTIRLPRRFAVVNGNKTVGSGFS